MRVRITKKPPPGYSVDRHVLRVGRIYDLDPSLASALILDDCAELYDLLTKEERRAPRDQAWQAADYPQKNRPSFGPPGRQKPSGSS